MNSFRFDTHMHFDLYGNKTDVLMYLEKNKSYTIAVTNLPILFKNYISVYNNFHYVRIALGFHPELANRYLSQLTLFDKHINETKYIGEIGLDYSNHDQDNQNIQKEVFSHIVSVCNMVGNKILTVHSRKAVDDVLGYLECFNGTVIMHWYSGSVCDMKRALNRGYYFSVNHQMIKSESGKKRIMKIPIDRILIESDAPFTSGMKKKYSLNFIDEIYQYLSQTRNMSTEEVSRKLRNNFIAAIGNQTVL